MGCLDMILQLVEHGALECHVYVNRLYACFSYSLSLRILRFGLKHRQSSTAEGTEKCTAVVREAR